MPEDMKRAVEEDEARATLRAAIVENPRAVWEQRRLERAIMIASVLNCMLIDIYVIGVCQTDIMHERQ